MSTLEQLIDHQAAMQRQVDSLSVQVLLVALAAGALAALVAVLMWKARKR